MAGRRQLDERRLKATIAYVTGKTHSGKLKLFKLLYLIDFTAYVKLGRSVTGESYKAAKLGPVPEYLSDNFDAVIADTVFLTKTDIGSENPEFRMAPQDTAPPISILDLEERQLINELLAEHGAKSGKQLTDMTHGELPYRLRSADRQQIPYRLAGYREFHKLSQAEIGEIVSDPQYMSRVRKGLAWYDIQAPDDDEAF